MDGDNAIKKSGSEERRNKLTKIRYQLNLLSSMSQEDGKLIDAIAKSSELSIFETDLIMDLIDWRWTCFA